MSNPLDNTDASAATPTNTSKKGCVILLLVLATLVGLAIWLIRRHYEPEAWVYVDNGNDRPVTVSVDGVEALTVSAETIDVLKCRRGQRHIKVVADGQVLFDEEKELKSTSRESPGKYLLNPGKASRHAEWTAKYKRFGSGVIPGGTEWGVVRSNFSHVVDELKEIRVLPAEEWVDCFLYDDVLGPAPPSIKGESGQRRVLSRIPKKDLEVFLSEPIQPKENAPPWEWRTATENLRAAIKRLHESKN